MGSLEFNDPPPSEVLPRDRALALLAECEGDGIWSVPYCRRRGVPEPWIASLADAYESGFQSDLQTIYYEGRPINQYHGVRDFDLAQQLGRLLGIDVDGLSQASLSRAALVQAIKESVLEE
jgi:hypothetical protein